MPATEDRSHPILNTDLDTEGPPDLYAVLSLTSTPSLSSAEIRSAYRKLALKFHPDKLPASLSESDKLAARHRFDQIGLAYKVLSDPARRARYDKSGRTDELDFLDGLEDEASWTAYFKDLWSGEVNARTIQEFTEKYRGSDEELNDLHAHYLEFDGSLEEILAHTMCATDACEPRLVGRIDASIAAGLLPAKPRWEREKKDTKARAVRRKNAAREAREAEELAKELGVHDKLFGGPSADSSAPKKGKHAARGAGKPEASEDALKALIQSKASGRHESLIAKLEAKALAETKKDTKKSKAGTKKRKATAAGQDDDDEEEVGNKQAVDPSEPTEEEFQQIQAQLDARRNKNQSSSAKPAAKSQAKGKKKAKTSK